MVPTQIPSGVVWPDVSTAHVAAAVRFSCAATSPYDTFPAPEQEADVAHVTLISEGIPVSERLGGGEMEIM